MELKYTYTRLLVSNFKECFLFYRDVMGFKATFGSEEDVYADFDTGGVAIALFDQNLMSAAIGTSHLPAQSTAQDKACLCFEVEDVDATSLHLGELGVRLVAPPTDHCDWGIRTAHFRDPAGNLIEINQGLKTS